MRQRRQPQRVEIALVDGKVSALRVSLAGRKGDIWIESPDLRFNANDHLVMTNLDRPALDEIAALAAARPVAVFAHGGIGRVLRGLFLGVPDAEVLKMDQPQDAFYRLHRGAAARIVS